METAVKRSIPRIVLSASIMLTTAVGGEAASRQLATLFTTEYSTVCKHDCIDELHYFCPSAEGTEGTCCNSASGCENTGDYCSFDASEDSLALKYWSCPRNADICGSEVLLAADKDGKELELAPVEAFEYQFTDGVICSYKLTFPWGAGEADRLIIEPILMENVRVYITEATSYFATDVLEYKLTTGDLVAVAHPAVAFITVVSTQVTEGGKFRLGYMYEYRDFETLTED